MLRRVLKLPNDRIRRWFSISPSALDCRTLSRLTLVKDLRISTASAWLLASRFTPPAEIALQCDPPVSDVFEEDRPQPEPLFSLNHGPLSHTWGARRRRWRAQRPATRGGGTDGAVQKARNTKRPAGPPPRGVAWHAFVRDGSSRALECRSHFSSYTIHPRLFGFVLAEAAAITPHGEAQNP